MSTDHEVPSLNRLLVVEDDPITGDLYRVIFQELTTVDVSPTATDALEKVQRNSYDLLLVDINLTGDDTSGINLLHQLRADEQDTKLPIVAVTAYTTAADREKLLAEGFDSYVAKPFTRERLLEGMIQALENTDTPGED